jgi:hypothetical protein
MGIATNTNQLSFADLFVINLFCQTGSASIQDLPAAMRYRGTAAHAREQAPANTG